MTTRDEIQRQVENQLDDILAEPPEHLSEAVLKTIKEDFVGYTKHVLNSVTSQELQSPFAYDRFVESTLAHARMRLHLR
jgi:hypothetical protein